MPEFAPGMRVIIRDEEWMIKKLEKNSAGNEALYCRGISALVKDRDAIFLSDLEEIVPVDPAEVKLVADDSANFRKSLLYIESQLRQQLPTDKNLHIGQNAAMNLMNYQLEPARRALEKTRQRILIADAVGLGKTLEAGILLSELIARGKGRRILVVTVKNMMTQFQKEMWNRFTIPLVRLDSAKIQKIRASLPANFNPFFYYDKTIVSVDTLKQDLEYRTHLENAYWDIIVIDEAQNVAARGTASKRSALAKLLADRSDAMILLSATPHDGRPESFASLMNMLDPTAIANEHDYTKDDIQGLCIHRTKNDIKDEAGSGFLERQVFMEPCKASAKEEAAFDIFADMQLDMDLSKKHNTGRLFKTSLEKAMFSSPAACIKSIDERLSKLRKKYNDNEIKDIKLLSELGEALAQIGPKDFSRYQRILSLLRSKEYGWDGQADDDRIVIFTERIETMKYLAAQLRTDLGLPEAAVQEISGAMSDEEQQTIVENFGRNASPVRILVASDVASEGLNLHYLSHRLIHFDIPWSLMVFQQRNGRVDRYGQQKRPDIRYFLIRSENERIKGDMRIMEILIEKEDQAIKNIGDAAMLLRKFDVEGEESVIVEAIETGSGAAGIEKAMIPEAGGIDTLSMLLSLAETPSQSVETGRTVTDETLFSDKDYLQLACESFGIAADEFSDRTGLDLRLNDEIKKRLSATLPQEAMPEGDTLRLSTSKPYIMKDMADSMKNNMAQTAWPKAQYLWRQHPIFSYINDKAGLNFDRGEAPLLGLTGTLKKGEVIYLLAGSIPNRKSTPLVDEIFGVYYQNRKFVKLMTLPEVLSRTKLQQKGLANADLIGAAEISFGQALLPEAIEEARKYLAEAYRKYQKTMEPLISEELDKLANLKVKHRDYQMSLFESKEKKSEQQRLVDNLFDKFSDYVEDTLTIENNPYIRVIAVMMGAEQ